MHVDVALERLRAEPAEQAHHREVELAVTAVGRRVDQPARTVAIDDPVARPQIPVQSRRRRPVVEPLERPGQPLQAVDRVRRERRSLAGDPRERHETTVRDELRPGRARLVRQGQTPGGPSIDPTEARRPRIVEQRQLPPEGHLVDCPAPRGVDPFEHEERRLAASLDRHRTPRRHGAPRTAPLDRSHSSPQASVPKKPAGGDACVLANSTSPDANSTRNAAAVSPPCTTDIPHDGCRPSRSPPLRQACVGYFEHPRPASNTPRHEIPDSDQGRASGGGSYPPTTSPRQRANANAVRSWRYGATTWMPTGSPVAVRPTGAAVTGR